MEPVDRKILVEVTPQEYNQIVSGNLGKDISAFSTKELIYELCNRGKKEDTLFGYDVKYDCGTAYISFFIKEDKLQAQINLWTKER